MRTLQVSGVTLGVMCLLAGCVAPGTTASQSSTPGHSADGEKAVAAPATAPASGTTGIQEARALERPVNAVGDVCYYERTIGYKKMKETRTLTSITDEKFVWDIQTDTGIKGVLETSVVDNRYVVTRDVSWANGQNVSIAPGYNWISFPAAPGQNWAVKTDFKGQTFNGTVEDEIKIEKWEKVKVPAGEFDALRMTFKSEYWNLPRKGTKPDVRGNMTLWATPAHKCLFVELKFSNSVGERGTTRLVASN